MYHILLGVLSSHVSNFIGYAEFRNVRSRARICVKMNVPRSILNTHLGEWSKINNILPQTMPYWGAYRCMTGMTNDEECSNIISRSIGLLHNALPGGGE